MTVLGTSRLNVASESADHRASTLVRYPFEGLSSIVSIRGESVARS